MANSSGDVLRPPRLRPGDLVRLVSPASTPTRESVEQAAATLRQLGLRVQVASHAMDMLGYLAGTDDDRAADVNDALQDPEVAAVIATRGGKGAYRIADRLDFAAARRHPKLVVGFSEITVLHLALWQHCRLPGIHGAPWDAATFGAATAQSFRQVVMTTEPIVIEARASEPTAALTTTGTATGVLIGGNQDMVATAAGWALPDLDGAILLLEAVRMHLGHIDRQLTMLTNTGRLSRLAGVAVGQYTECTPGEGTTGDWTVIDVLRDRLHRLGIPVLGGLPIGHGPNPVALPIGTTAVLDAAAGTLTAAPAVR